MSDESEFHDPTLDQATAARLQAIEIAIQTLAAGKGVPSDLVTRAEFEDLKTRFDALTRAIAEGAPK